MAPTKTQETVAGILSRQVYYGNNFLVGRLDTGATVVGSIVDPTIGDEYEFYGSWDKHPTYGKQFRFRQYVKKLPQSQAGIVRYLTRAKWLGTKRANAVAQAYGKDTLEVLRTNPQRVAEDIAGITEERALEIQAHLQKHKALEGATVQLEEMLAGVKGLPKDIAVRLLADLGSDAPHELKRNPYRLVGFRGVGFLLADRFALSIGYKPEGIHRRSAAVEYVLKTAASNEGHTVLPAAEIVTRVRSLIGIDPSPGLANLAAKGSIVLRPGDRIALQGMYKAEKGASEALRRLISAPVVPCSAPLDNLTPDQRGAVKAISGASVAVLTGPPGSGKTYTLARIVKGWKAAGVRGIAFCAPTGKAATRMTESLADTLPGARASTIHRLLDPQPMPDGSFSFGYGPDNQLELGGIVVDEVSMLDVNLAASLFGAVKTGTRLLLVGDVDQLPSVGPGAVLADMIGAGIPTARLDSIVRNAGQIVKACSDIRKGKPFAWAERFDIDAGENLRHIKKVSGRDIIATIVALVDKMPSLGFDPFWDFQVLAPMNTRSQTSVAALNKALGDKLNPGPLPKGLDFRVGDKVVRTKNALAKTVDLGVVEIVNGDIGIVDKIEGSEIVVSLVNPPRQVILPRLEHHLQRAFCMTCHKLQGSDAPVIAMPLHRSFGTFPTREWLYTAISRAKTLCLTVGSKGVALDMIARRAAKRRTMLKGLLSEARNP